MSGVARQPERHRADRIHIVIPAFNEAATIGKIVRQCRAAVESPCVIVVDDGSYDGTAAIATQNGARVLRLCRNQGKGAALMEGMRAAIADGAAAVVTLDGDGQHQPQDLQRLLACSSAWPGHIVIGSRRASGNAAPQVRRIANRIADFWVSWAARHPIEDSQSGFRVYPARAMHLIAERLSPAHGFAFESELLIEAGRIGIRTVAVDIPAIYGSLLRRRSHFRPVADITKIVLMVGGKLLARKMDPIGLWRSLTLRRLRDTSGHAAVD
jgi:glycosyltransferase involved in cell wall biosynthesis